MSSTRLRLLADVDTGIDDSLALIYLAGLHRAKEIELVGVTCSGGNTTAAEAARNTKYILSLCGCPDVPVASGFEGPEGIALTTTPETHGPSGLGYNLVPPMPMHEPGLAGVADPLALWRRVIEEADSVREQVQLLVTGPLTTYAAAMKQCPRHVQRLAGVTVMGGALDYPGNTTDFSEWNFWVDPIAMTEVFPGQDPTRAQLAVDGGSFHAWPVPTLAPLNVTETITVDNTDLDSWRAAGMGFELFRVVRRALQFYFEFHQWVGVGYLAQIHDLFAAMVSVGTAPCEMEQSQIKGVDKLQWQEQPARRGQIVRDRNGTRVNVVTRADRRAVMVEFERAIGFLPNHLA